MAVEPEWHVQNRRTNWATTGKPMEELEQKHSPPKLGHPHGGKASKNTKQSMVQRQRRTTTTSEAKTSRNGAIREYPKAKITASPGLKTPREARGRSTKQRIKVRENDQT